MNFMSVGTAMVAVFSLSACATVTRGTKQKFTFLSEPSGADVVLTNRLSCVTPCRIKVRRKEKFAATISKPGFKPVVVRVERKLHIGGVVALAGNAVIGGIIGAVVDATNGSLLGLKPGPINVTLVPEDAVTPVASAVAPMAGAPAAPQPN